MDETLDLHKQFQDFLGLSGENGEEIDLEIKELLKMAFYAGSGRTLLILNDHAVNMEEKMGVSVIDNLFRQIHSFF